MIRPMASELPAQQKSGLSPTENCVRLRLFQYSQPLPQKQAAWIFVGARFTENVLRERHAVPLLHIWIFFILGPPGWILKKRTGILLYSPRAASKTKSVA
jgi:hypothetical protein